MTYTCRLMILMIFIYFADGINSWTLGGVPVLLPSGQLSGAPCRTQVLVIRDFRLRVHVHYKHALLVQYIMHIACVHVHMYVHPYALCDYTRHLRTCRYAAIHVNRPSGISQAACCSRQPYTRAGVHYTRWLGIV